MSKLTSKKHDPIDDVVWATEEEFNALKQLAASRVVDGVLSEEDVDRLSEAIDAQEEHGRLTEDQQQEIQQIIREGVEARGASEITKPMKVFAILSLVGGLLSIAALIVGAVFVAQTGTNLAAGYQGSNVELALMVLQAVLFVCGVVLHTVLGARLLRGKRYGASHIASTLVVAGVIDIFLEVMLTGIGLNFFFVLLLTAFRIALSSYLNPSLAQERKLAGKMRMSDTKVRAHTNTLGLDLSGKGFIKLDFFNIFWVFVVTCVLGVIVEVIWHMVIVDPGVYQDRRGLLFGPFSPIYGIGAVLMTVALNRFKNSGLLITFIACTIIGGAFEYAVSWWLEVSYGVIAWDYSGQFLNVGGRTCLAFASMFGLLGLWWVKWALPRMLALINKIPWKTRYAVTTVCAVLMLFNVGMTLQALDCWQQRVNGEPVVTDVQKFYAEHFDNDEMQNRFQSMTMKPQNKG